MYQTIAEYDIKPGDAISEVIQFLCDTLPVATGGIMQVRRHNDLIADIDVAVTAISGGFQVELTLADTSDWPVDVELESDLVLYFAAGTTMPAIWTAGNVSWSTHQRISEEAS